MRATVTTSLALALLLIPGIVLACLWDSDTLRMERSRFPSALELITGKFLRHSEQFYQWRIADRLKKLEENPNHLPWYDDLAVAYDKTGQHQKAIEVMLKKDQISPGLYETEANLGTFYIHAGEFETGLKHIERAIAINPEAHFGREEYQLKLVKYMLSRSDGVVSDLPLAEVLVSADSTELGDPASMEISNDFASYLLPPGAERLDAQEREQAIRGVLGMMRFGHHDSPVLLEALGSLLSAGPMDEYEEDAKLLAARAFLKASYEVSDPSAKLNYRRMAARVLVGQLREQRTTDEIRLEEVERAFQKELAEAEEWYAQLKQSELGWIRGGKDPEKQFDRLYENTMPELSDSETTSRTYPVIPIALGVLGVVGTPTLIILLAFLIRAAR